MSWLSALPTEHITSYSQYYDLRTSPSDEDKWQAQLHEITVKEYRGLTYTCAFENCKAEAYSNGTKSASMTAIEGGGYTLIITWDYSSGPWVNIS